MVWECNSSPDFTVEKNGSSEGKELTDGLINGGGFEACLAHLCTLMTILECGTQSLGE